MDPSVPSRILIEKAECIVSRCIAIQPCMDPSFEERDGGEFRSWFIRGFHFLRFWPSLRLFLDSFLFRLMNSPVRWSHYWARICTGIYIIYHGVSGRVRVRKGYGRHLKKKRTELLGKGRNAQIQRHYPLQPPPPRTATTTSHRRHHRRKTLFAFPFYLRLLSRALVLAVPRPSRIILDALFIQNSPPLTHSWP